MAAVSMFTELAELPIAKQADAVQRKINEQGFDLLSSLVAELALMNSVPRGYPFQTAILAL